MADSEQLALLRDSIPDWNQWRKNNPTVEPDLSRSELSGLDLQKADLSGANLQQVNFSGANLHRADLSRSDLILATLIQVDLSSADLNCCRASEAEFVKSCLVGTNLTEAYLYGTDFSNCNLMHANLRRVHLHSASLKNTILVGADISEAYLAQADFSASRLNSANLERANLTEAKLNACKLEKVNLTEASLSRTQALITCFDEAIFTGACIADWSINSHTSLRGVVCDYVYMKEAKKERFPIDRIFTTGEFSKLFQKASSIVELIFHNGVDWISFAYSFGKLKIEHENNQLVVQSIENRGDGIVSVKVSLSPSEDRVSFHREFMRGYEFSKKTLQKHYYERLKDKEKHINQLFYLLQESQEKLGEVPRIMSEQPKVQQNFQSVVYGVSGNVEGDQIVNVTEQRKTLVESAAEIQSLLEQLSQSYPSDTLSQRMDLAKEAIGRIENDPSLMSRITKALRAGSVSALEQLLNHPAASFLIAALEEWKEDDT